jgi:beta-galactosidase
MGTWRGAQRWLSGLADCQGTDTRQRSNLPQVCNRFLWAIGQQLHDLLWKDGGPVIGIQLENEYANRTANGGEAHILKLKQLAIASGLDVPLYSVTGWDNAAIPPARSCPSLADIPMRPGTRRPETSPPAKSILSVLAAALQATWA